MDFNVNISPTELNKFYNINLTPNQTPQQQSKKTTTQYVDHEVVAALDCAQTKQCNTNHNDNQPHISIGNTLSIPHDTSGYRSILENELSTFNRGFEAQKKLLIQQQLLDSKVQKVKKKRHIEPSADINDFFKLLNKHDKGMVNMFLIDSMNANQQQLQYTTRTYYNGRLVVRGSYDTCLGAVVGNPQNEICSACYPVSKSATTHCGCRKCNKIYICSVHDFTHHHIKRTHQSDYKLATSEFNQKLTTLRHISALPIQYAANRPKADTSNVLLKKRIGKKSKLSQKQKQQIKSNSNNNNNNNISSKTFVITEYIASTNNSKNNEETMNIVDNKEDKTEDIAPKPIISEQRLLPYVEYTSTMSQLILRVKNSKQLRFFHGQKIESSMKRIYTITDSDKNTYNVTIGHLIDCNCYIWKSGKLVCDDYLFVMIKILKVGLNSHMLYQRALLSNELETIFTNAPPILIGSWGKSVNEANNAINVTTNSNKNTQHIGKKRKSTLNVSNFDDFECIDNHTYKKQKLNNTNEQIPQLENHNPNIPTNTQDLVSKQFFGYNHYQMQSISDKGILHNNSIVNTKKKKTPKTLQFSQIELNEYSNGSMINISATNLNKYKWTSVSKLCKCIGVKTGGTKNAMIERIKTSKQYSKKDN
eukprot:5624_1